MGRNAVKNSRKIKHVFDGPSRTGLTALALAIAMFLAAPDASAQSQTTTATPPSAPDSTPAQAQGKPETPNQAKPEKVKNLEQVVVTANDQTQKLSEVGGAISVMTGEDLQNMGASSFQDYIGFVPGVSLESYGRPGQTQVSIRGISSQSVGATTAVYLDDIPISQSSNESQGAAYTPDLNPHDLDSVEVLKGPQGTLYGASSLGGLIRYVTKDPSLTTSDLETSEDVSSIDGGGVGYKLQASGSTPIINNVLGVRLSAYSQQDGGFIDNTLLGQNNVNRSRASGFNVSALYKPTENLEIRLIAILQNTQAHGINEVDYNLDTPPPPFLPVYGDLKNQRYIQQPSHIDNRIYGATVHYDFGSFNLVSATGFTQQKIDSVLDVTSVYGPLLGTTPGDGNKIGLNTSYNINKLTQEVRLQSKQNETFDWTVGTFFQNEHSTDQGLVSVQDAAGQLAPYPIGNPLESGSKNDLQEYAGFANATYYLAPSFDISAGYRYSSIGQDNDQFMTGLLFNPAEPSVRNTTTTRLNNDVNTYSLGARWRITPDVMLYARAASGFRPGGDRTLPPVAVSAGLTPTYEPDSVWSYEVGAKASAFDNRFSINVDGFWINWKNIQNLQLIQGFYVQGNVGAARSRGVETDFQLQPVKGLTVTGSFAYTDAVYTQGNIALGINPGDPLNAIAKYTSSLRAEYEAPIGGSWSGFIGTDVQYRGHELDLVNVEMPSYTLVGLHVGAETDTLRGEVYVSNLTNVRGLLGTTTGNVLPYSFAVVQPRTIGLRFTQNF
jgi:iron complex outermembrane recepter protein